MIPYSRPKLADLYTLSQSKLLENYTLHNTAAQTYIAYICQSPLPGVLPKRSLSLSPQNSLLMTWMINVYIIINLVVMGFHSASLFKKIWGPTNHRHFCNENVSSGEERDEMTVLYCWYPVVSISTDDRRNASVTLLRVVDYFLPQKEAIGFKNIVNKKYIIKSELKRKFVVRCFQGPLICYALVTPEALLVAQTLYCISVNFSHISL